MIIRKRYIEKLESFCRKELIKVITGIRRCGKSVLMDQFILTLMNKGISENNIIKINFEEKENEHLLDKDILYKFLIKKYKSVKSEYLYIFLDEVQKVNGFQEIIDSLYVKKNIDIYITGSNAELLSSQLATLLTGRYVEIHLLPLSYDEFLNNRTESIEMFNDYLANGGMPYLLNLETDEMKYTYLSGLYNTVINNDVVKIHNDIDLTMFENIFMYMCDNVSTIVSANSIAKSLTSFGKKVTNNTVEKYLRYMKECFLLYECNRYNVIGKQSLKTLSKYYLVDLGFKKLTSLKNETNIGHKIENIVYVELLRRGYKVNVGKVYDLEIDFVTELNGIREYIQVSTSLYDEKVKLREISSLTKIKDNYKKIILTLDDYGLGDANGIEIINLRKWLTYR